MYLVYLKKSSLCTYINIYISIIIIIFLAKTGLLSLAIRFRMLIFKVFKHILFCQSRIQNYILYFYIRIINFYINTYYRRLNIIYLSFVIINNLSFIIYPYITIYINLYIQIKNKKLIIIV